jgi:hypothetical protein
VSSDQPRDWPTPSRRLEHISPRGCTLICWLCAGTRRLRTWGLGAMARRPPGGNTGTLPAFPLTMYPPLVLRIHTSHTEVVLRFASEEVP